MNKHFDKNTKRQDLYYIVTDYTLGSSQRIEIPADGHGEMQVCTGFRYVRIGESNRPRGKEIVPVFKTFRW